MFFVIGRSRTCVYCVHSSTEVYLRMYLRVYLRMYLLVRMYLRMYLRIAITVIWPRLS